MPRMSLACCFASAGRLGELDAAALAAAAGVDLRLDDDDGGAEPLRGLLGLGRRLGQPALGHGDAVLAKQLLRLILVNVHGEPRLRPGARCRVTRSGNDRQGAVATLLGGTPPDSRTAAGAPRRQRRAGGTEAPLELDLVDERLDVLDRRVEQRLLVGVQIDLR